MKVRNCVPRILGLATGQRLLPRQELELSAEQVQALLASPQFRAWQKLGWVRLLQVNPKAAAPLAEEEPQEDPQESALDGLNVQEAKLIIEACKDLDLLSRWHAREGRKTVKKALVERVAALQAPAQPPVEPEVESEDAEGVDDLEDEDIFDGTGPEG